MENYLNMLGIRINRDMILCHLLFIAAWVLFSCSISSAQTFYPKHFRFDSYTINDGLSESLIPVIAEDKYGEICIATEKGMDIFNGYDFEHISTINLRKSITDQPEKLGMIRQISQWQNGYLFILKYDTTSFLFDPADRSFTATDSLINFSSGENRWKFRRINCILKVREGISWIGTNNGILIFGRNTSSGIPSFKHIFAGHSVQITALREDHQNRIWALTSRNEILIIDQVTCHLLYKVTPADLGMKKNTAGRMVLYADPAGNTYIGTSAGVYCFKGIKDQSPSFKHIPLTYKKEHFGNTRVNCLLRDATGLLWIGTGNGILLYDVHAEKMIRHLVQTPFYPRTLNSNQIYCIIEDSHHRIWIGTDNGVNKFDPYSQKFALYDQDPVNPEKKLSLVFSIIGLDSQHIIAVSKGRPVMINTRTHQMDYIVARGLNKNILTHCLTRESSGMIWCGTSSGLKTIKKVGGRYFIEDILVPELKPLQHLPLYDVLSIGDSLLWLGSKNSGLYLWNRRTHSLTHFLHEDKNPHSICNNNITFMMKDQRGNCWFGTFGGISRYDPSKNQFDNFLTNEFSINTYPQCIIEDGKYLWVATYNNGLIKFDPEINSHKRYTVADGLPDNNIYACVLDNAGHLWLTSDKGISEFIEAKKSFRNFTKEDGLQSNEFDANSVYKNAEGDLFFGGVYGINKLEPGKIDIDTFPVPVMVSNISVLSPDGEYNIFPGDQKTFAFSYQENTFLIRFEALNFASPEFNHYRYKLINDEVKDHETKNNSDVWDLLTLRGFMNNTWINAGNRNTIVYSRVPPGRYTFQLSAKNRDGLWNKTPLSLSIIIKPPFWQTTWFKILGVLVILLLIYGIFRFRLRAIKKAHRQKLEKTEMDQKIMELERMALRAQMNPHFIFNSLNSIKAYILDSEPDEAVEYLNDFAALIRKVLQNSRKEKIPLSEELEAIEKYVKLEERRLKKKVRLVIKPDKEYCLSNILIPPLIIQPFIENAIWHGIRPITEEGVIEVSIQEVDHSLKVSITDNGIGREKASTYRTGNYKMQSMGVPITQARLSHINGKKIKNILYEDVAGHKGTKVTLWIHKEEL